MSKFDDQYIDLCRKILTQGEKITNYQKNDNRSASVTSVIPDHTAKVHPRHKQSDYHIKYYNLILKKNSLF